MLASWTCGLYLADTTHTGHCHWGFHIGDSELKGPQHQLENEKWLKKLKTTAKLRGFDQTMDDNLQLEFFRQAESLLTN